MAWLRVDDGLAEHRKLLPLKRADRWTWVEVLCYVARQGNGGHVPDGVQQIIRHATPAFLGRCHELGLLDLDGERYVVHDWAIYNGGTLEERVAAYLDQYPQATANQVCKGVGGGRNLTLQLVQQYRKGGT